MIKTPQKIVHDWYSKLRNTYLTEVGELDLEKSFFQLNALATSLITNTHKNIELLAFEHPDNKIFNESFANRLSEIKQALIAYGLNSNRVTINDKLKPNSSDEFGNFYFGIRFQ